MGLVYAGWLAARNPSTREPIRFGCVEAADIQGGSIYLTASSAFNVVGHTSPLRLDPFRSLLHLLLSRAYFIFQVSRPDQTRPDQENYICRNSPRWTLVRDAIHIGCSSQTME